MLTQLTELTTVRSGRKILFFSQALLSCFPTNSFADIAQIVIVLMTERGATLIGSPQMRNLHHGQILTQPLATPGDTLFFFFHHSLFEHVFLPIAFDTLHKWECLDD